MAISSEQEIRLLKVTAANLRNKHLYVNGHYDFFPADLIGPSKRNGGAAGKIEIALDGLDKTIVTDVGSEADNGKPRGFLRARGWIGKFYQRHRVMAGTTLAIEKLEDRKFRLSVHSRGPSATASLRAAEFFAGIGLVRLGLEANGIEVVFANDIDPDKYEMYRDNFDASHFRLGDIHDLSAKDVPDCDLFTASFPCNDLSIAGAMKGLNSGQSSAFWGFVEIVRGMGTRRPPAILIENVPGFLMSRCGKDFEQALLALNQLGYAVDAVILDAAHFVPQSRARLFVVAKLDGAAKFPFGLESSVIRPRALADFIVAHPHIQWDITNLPDPPPRSSSLESILEKQLPDDDPAWWNRQRAEYFMGQLSERHLAIAKKMISRSKVSYGAAFRRIRHGRSMAELRVDGLAGCLRTPRGGSGRQILFKAGRGKYQVRLLTARECARLQGVPDDFKIDVPLNQALFGFGDAVCVPAVEWIAKHYMMTGKRAFDNHSAGHRNVT